MGAPHCLRCRVLVSTADTDRPRLNGRYRLDRILGEGGFGTVYVAYDERRGIDVALKLLSRVGPESVARFKGEFRSAAAVAHPGLVVLHELGFDGDTQRGVGRWYITMDLLEGADFASHRLGKIKPSQSIRRPL